MEEMEEKLKLSAEVIRMSKDFSAFKYFLEAYIECEIQHIDSFLSKEEYPNIRSASLCYEALATAKGLLELIDGDKGN
jgi:hypothetical protein